MTITADHFPANFTKENAFTMIDQFDSEASTIARKFKSILSVCELDKDCTRVIGDQVLVFDGKKNGNDTVEGPKFYKRDGWYYIFAPSGGVKTGWQLVLRSRNVLGPYEHRTVLHQGPTDIHGPHQGGWVTDTAGDSWFMHFEDRYAWGRVCHLQPMGVKVSLDKQVTVCADSYFCRVDDTYRFTGAETLTVAAGLLRHSAQETIEQERLTPVSYAIWEHASDQSVEPEDGMLGVAVVVPGAKDVCVHEDLDHGIATREIKSGEVFTYCFGSCWSKGDLKTAEDWFAEVEKQK